MSDGRTEAGGHTAGKWFLGVNFPPDIQVINYYGVEETICGVYETERDGEDLANASLIARAPDLLAENERLRAALGEMMDHLCGFNPCSQWEYIWEGVQHARESGSAALARTGKDGG